MITLHFFLDCRATGDGRAAPLKLGVCKRSQTAFLLTGISLLPDEWDKTTQRVINHPRKKILNSDLSRLKADAEDYLRPMLYNGELADLPATQIRDLVKGHLYGHFTALYLKEVYFPVLKSKTGNTAVSYADAWKRLSLYDENIDTLPLRGVTADWVRGFLSWADERGYKANTQASTLRSLKAVWRKAAEDGKVSGDPFKGISVQPAATHGKDFSLDQIRTLWRAVPQVPSEALALDFFKLSFLMRAINPTDLYSARKADIANGRYYYNRKKTGKAISVRIEPEAAEIIARRGSDTRLFSVRYALRSLVSLSNKYLKQICKREGLPPASLYWARHTLASLLFEQGGTMDIVSAILSHSLGGAKVTATYVAVRESKLDEAMRQVIDAVVR